MDKFVTLIGAALMLYAAYLLWQKAQRQPIVAYYTDDTRTRSGYIPPAAPPRDSSLPYQGRDREGSFEGCEDDDQPHVISQETLAAWAAADAADNQTNNDERLPDIIKPSWGTNLYESLGVSRDATPDQIRTAYKDQLKIWHPDVNKSADAEKEFITIQQAYRTLTTQRAQYDAGLAIEQETTFA